VRYAHPINCGRGSAAILGLCRSRSANPVAAVEAEGQKVLGKVKAGEQLVVLDERGTELSSIELAGELSVWQAAGRDICFVIGGPDGVSKSCMERADLRWSLSAHPYHRA
jgi:23S rRNA (pseudouridine1915-N3)-methyltransferase